MKDVMIDLETMGTSANAAIVQVGAVYFDRHTGELGKEFKKNISLESAVASGASVDPGTIEFWLKQNDLARQSILAEPRLPILEVMNNLNGFLLAPGDVFVWGHATFDVPIVQQTNRRLAVRASWKFRNARDLRTLLDLAGIDPKSFPRDGVYHDALDDAKHQVKQAVACFRKLEQPQVWNGSGALA